MKDIIRQAVADAAEWLYQNRSTATQGYLMGKRADVLISVAKSCMDHDTRVKRDEQLRQAEDAPIKTLSLSCDAWPESLHLAAIKGETVTLSFDPGTATPGQLRSLAQGWSSVPALSQLAKSVDQVVIKGPGGFMTRCVMAEPMVSVPRSELEALRDGVDLYSAKELTGEEMAIIQALIKYL